MLKLLHILKLQNLQLYGVLIIYLKLVIKEVHITEVCMNKHSQFMNVQWVDGSLGLLVVVV